MISFMFSAANLMGNLLFSGIGFVAFIYGKKQGLWKPVVLGIILMIYPYFISNEWMMYGVGIALTACLYFFRE